VINAARVAYTFHLDPLLVLDDLGPDGLHLLIRTAAAQVVDRDERAQAAEARRESRR
jgi:hypothetical protein